MKRLCLLLLIGAYVALAIALCGWFGLLIVRSSQLETLSQGIARARAERAAGATGDIVVGVAATLDDPETSPLWDGAVLAAETLNARGGVGERPLRLVRKNDGGALGQARLVAQELAEDLDVVAVVGHSVSDLSLETSLIYEHYGLLMVTPLSTNPRLTRQGYHLVFRSLPSDDQFGLELARAAADMGWADVVVFYENSAYGQGLVAAFQRQSEDRDVRVVDRQPFELGDPAALSRETLHSWKQYFVFDGIVLIGSVQAAAPMIARIRQEGLEAPLLSSETLDSDQTLRLAGAHAEGLTVVSAFDPDDPRPLVQTFRAAYRERWGADPTFEAAQGYDAIRLLAEAMDRGGSTAPDRIAAELGGIADWDGLSGPLTIGADGETRLPILRKRVVQGRWVVLPSGP